jgi:hypothetical protein
MILTNKRSRPVSVKGVVLSGDRINARLGDRCSAALPSTGTRGHFLNEPRYLPDA